ncbi:MAG: hypothetical protein AB7G17_08430 [Phycisphaerales bacterium]
MIGAIREIVRVMSLPCVEHAPLFSRAQDERLPWATRTGLRMHTWVCAPCRRLRRQLRELANAARALRQSAGPIEPASMPGDVRERLRRATSDLR